MKIALAGWSLNRRFRDKEHPFALLAFPRTVRQEFAIDAVELNNVFFASTEDEYLGMLTTKAEQAGVRLIGLAVDGIGDLSHPDEAERENAMTEATPWLDVAAKLGLDWIRFNAGGQGNEELPEALHSCIRSLQELCNYAQRFGLKVLIENHWGILSCPQRILTVLHAVNAPNLGTLLDFGNFSSRVDHYEGIEKIATFAGAVHVKTHQFNDQGEESRIDMARCLKILRAAKFNGYLCIEYLGDGDDREGVLQTKTLIERHLPSNKKAH